MLPTQQLLEKVSQEIQTIPNKRKESKRGIHYGLFLLGYKSGLRISEAVSFSLANKMRQGLYHIKRTKGKKERLVYIPKKVISELKKTNWQPNQTNRWNFYHFLWKVKKELGISKSIELTPHTLRRAFATYQAESGMPLPLLQKLLGHSSIRTTALYWQNIYQESDSDISSILAGKNWLERPKSSQKKNPPKPPTIENFLQVPKSPEPVFIANEPVNSRKRFSQQDNSPSTKKISKKRLELVRQIPPKSQEKFLLNSVSKKNDQLKISQQLTLIPNQREKITETELILLVKIKSLEKQLVQIKMENNNLKVENKHLKSLIQQDQARTEAQIIQTK